MYNNQSNKARYIYTLSNIRKDNTILLNNNLYFAKECRSDEKLRYTEADMCNIVRVLCFIYAFECSIESSMVDLARLGDYPKSCIVDVNFIYAITNLSILDFVAFIDKCMGNGFTAVCKRPFQKIYHEIVTVWKLGIPKLILSPSAHDFMLLRQFVGMTNSEYSKSAKFILS